MILIPGAELELGEQQQGPLKEFHVKFAVGEALIWGSLTMHSVAPCSYNEGYHICLVIHLHS